MTAATASVRLAGTGMPDGPPGLPLLATDGPRVVLGGADPLLGPVAPSATSMFGPRGARRFADGALVVADTGHHRLLIWNQSPDHDGAPAEAVLGQPGFDREGRNALGDPTALTLNVPTSVAPWPTATGPGLIVADTWNNRVLIWHTRPRTSGVAADLVLGQADFAGGAPNRGGEVDADTMHWPTQAMVIDGQLVVCDVGNRRILIWSTLPATSGAPADRVLGQQDLRCRSDNGGLAAGPQGLRWPHDVCMWAGDLVVADAGNNRLLVFDGLPADSYPAAREVIGQADFVSVDHNQAGYWATARALNMPYAVDAIGDVLVCADTANSRLVAYRRDAAERGHAIYLAGQANFHAKGDNRWQAEVRDSVCWPYGVKLDGRTAVLADTGNHRVCLWPLAAEVAP